MARRLGLWSLVAGATLASGIGLALVLSGAPIALDAPSSESAWHPPLDGGSTESTNTGGETWRGDDGGSSLGHTGSQPQGSRMFAGVVVDQRGRPVAGALVRWTTDGNEDELRVHSDSAGTFSFVAPADDLSATIIASAPGLLDASISIATHTENPLRLVLEEAQVISGRVEDEAAQPVADAVVVVRPDCEPGKQSETTTNRAGFFVFEAMRRGQFMLEVEHAHYLAAQTRGVAPATAIRVVLARGETLEGRVFDSRNAVPGVRVVVSQRGGPAVRETLTDEAGRFALHGLERIRYQVKATIQASIGTADADLTSPKRAPISVFLKPTYRVSGRTLDERGNGIGGVRVVASGSGDSVTSDDEGRFEVTGLQGAVELAAFRIGYVHRDRVAFAQAAANVRLTLSTLGHVRGRSLDTARRTLSEICLNGGLAQTSAGAFELAIPDQAGTLVVGAPGNYPVAIRVARSSPWDDVDLGDIILGGGRRVTLHVADDATRRPVENARVAVRLEGKTCVLGFTSARGDLEVVGVPIQRVSLMIDHEGYSPRMVEVEPGSVDVFGLLMSKLRLAVRVRDERGKKVSAKLLFLPREGEPLLTNSSLDGEFSYRPSAPGPLAIAARSFAPTRRGWATANVTDGESAVELVLAPAAVVVNIKIQTRGAWVPTAVDLMPQSLVNSTPMRLPPLESLAGVSADHLSENVFRVSDAIPGEWLATVLLLA